MGWLFNTVPSTKQQYVAQIIREYVDGPPRCLLLASSLRGNHLWVLIRNADADPIIGLFLLSSDNGCWGCKSLSEEDGPLHYDCPLGWLDRAPEPKAAYRDGHRGSGRTWRDHVRDHHEALSKRRHLRPKVGDRIALPEGVFTGFGGEYRVTCDLGRKGLLLNSYLRLNSHQLKWVEPVNESPAVSR